MVNIEWIEKKYNEYNKKYFGNKLPQIEFKTDNSKKRWGYASYRYNLGTGKITPLSITISNYYESPEDIKINTLLHEMIHIEDYAFHPEHFIVRDLRWNAPHAYKKVSGRSYDAHGSWFKSECDRINALGNHKVSTRVQAWEVADSHLNAKAQAALDKKRSSGSIIGYFSRLKKDGYEWFKVKTNENGMKKLTDKVLGNDYYQSIYGKVEWYRTFNERYVNMRNQITSLTGWYRTNAVKESEVSSEDMELIATVQIHKEITEKDIIKSLGVTVHNIMSSIWHENVCQRKNELVGVYLCGSVKDDMFTLECTYADNCINCEDFRVSTSWSKMKDVAENGNFDELYGKWVYVNLKKFGIIKINESVMNIRRIIRESINEFMELNMANKNGNEIEKDPLRHVKQISDDEFIESIE